MPEEAKAYTEGWEACMNGEDPCFTCPYNRNTLEERAWVHGALGAMEAEDGEEPDPKAAGYV